jgi:predicted DNA binding CopG/RHH family protein
MKKKRLILTVPAGIHTDIKKLCAEQGITMQEFLSDAIRRKCRHLGYELHHFQFKQSD